ncbi:MAG: glycosyl hydrolase family 32 [Verrucomicrobia bacterium]|nr:MAG: glycosyl hydrolase family 32 [Verrucomicrobiota bacterium]
MRHTERRRFALGALLVGLLCGVAIAAAGEELYNGIQLPTIWPPRDGDPKSTEPMTVPYLQNPPKIIPINIGRQLFVDDFLIEQTDLTRVFHQAQKFAGNPVLTPTETDGEGRQKSCAMIAGGVFYDPAERAFKMFYDAGGLHGGLYGALALATSTDLIHWRRPNVGLAGTNWLLPKSRNFNLQDGAGRDRCLWLDLNTEQLEERIKYMAGGFDAVPGDPLDGKHLMHLLKTSSDGRAWSRPVRTGPAEDYSTFFYNPFRKVWVFSIKGPHGFPCRDRCRYYAENRDFLAGADWGKAMVYWTNADRLDEPDPAIGEAAQLYCLNAVAYESLLLGEFQIHLGPKNEVCDAEKSPKITELKLGFSRDGFHWQRPDRCPFIAATRKAGDWDRGYIHGAVGVCVVLGDKLYFPYCGFSGFAPDGARGMYYGGSIGMATLRRDGFASMDAGAKPGTLTTRPVVFDGKKLFVNLAAPQGELRVEILDEQKQVIAPFSVANCTPITADKTLLAVEWKGTADLSALAGKPVKFRFQLTNGKLYAFWVSPDQSGASRGYVAAGGPGFSGTLDGGGALTRQTP